MTDLFLYKNNLIPKVLWTVVSQFEEAIIKARRESLKYNINIDKMKNLQIEVEDKKTKQISMRSGFIIGTYDEDKEIWDMFNHEQMFRIYNKKDELYNIFGNTPIGLKVLESLFNNNTKIESKYHKIIPYLLQFLNSGFNLVRFRYGNNTYIYILIALDIETDIDWNEVSTTLGMIQTLLAVTSQKINMSRQKLKKQSKKKRSKSKIKRKKRSK
jgi:hypothetical protein